MTKNNPKPRKPENDLSHLVKGSVAVCCNGKDHSLSIHFIGCNSNVVNVALIKREDGNTDIDVAEYKFVDENGKKQKMGTGKNEVITIRGDYPTLSDLRQLQDDVQKKVSSQLEYSPDDSPIDPLGDKPHRVTSDFIHSAVVSIIKSNFDVVESN